jgi:hypothetical protein
MSYTSFFLVLLSITLTHASLNCVYLGNHILQWQIQNQTTITIHAQLWRGAAGWAAISFTNASQTHYDPYDTWTIVVYNRTLHEYAGLPTNVIKIPKQNSSLVGEWKVWTFEPKNRDFVTIEFSRTLIGKVGFGFSDNPQLVEISYNRKHLPFENGTLTDVTLPPISKYINFYQPSK